MNSEVRISFLDRVMQELRIKNRLPESNLLIGRFNSEKKVEIKDTAKTKIAMVGTLAFKKIVSTVSNHYASEDLISKMLREDSNGLSDEKISSILDSSNSFTDFYKGLRRAIKEYTREKEMQDLELQKTIEATKALDDLFGDSKKDSVVYTDENSIINKM